MEYFVGLLFIAALVYFVYKLKHRKRLKDRPTSPDYPTHPTPPKRPPTEIPAFLLALLLPLAAPPADAYDATLTWAHPTSNTDGTTIPAAGAGSLTQTRIEFGTCNSGAFGTRQGEVIAPFPLTTYSIPGFTAGQVVCYRAYSKNTFGNESVPSGTVSKTFPTPTPNAPVLSATITVAYEISMNAWGDVKVGRAVGTFPAGTPCIDNPIWTNKGEMYEIDREAVRLTKQPKSSIIVTKCEWHTS